MFQNFLKLVVTVLVVMGMSTAGFAQVTTALMNGSVVDSKGEAVPGAQVQATHEPSARFIVV